MLIHKVDKHDRSFKCDKCDFATPRNYLLAKHLKDKHSVKQIVQFIPIAPKGSLVSSGKLPIPKL